MAREDVLGRLRDPASAAFSGLVWDDNGTSAVVCGRVNARNGFGGMAGDRRFIRRFSKEERAYAYEIVGQPENLRDLSKQNMVLERGMRDTVQWSADPKAASAELGPDPVLVFEGDVPPDQLEAVWVSRCMSGRPALQRPL